MRKPSTLQRLLLCAAAATLWVVVEARAGGQELTMPLRTGSLRFAAIGDSGTGTRFQYEVAERMAFHAKRFMPQFVVMAGDNLYGKENPEDFAAKFEKPYGALLDAGVKFYAALGNHDDSARQTSYEQFNMRGQRYYTFAYGRVQFFALDTNRMDPVQTLWAEEQLSASTAEWKIAYFHHPLYSSGRYGSTLEVRQVLEPLFVKYGVNVVLAGHEHSYERIKPQSGVVYFNVGNAGSVRVGSVRPTPLTAAAFDADGSFMLVEIAGDDFFFQVISKAGNTVDHGSFLRQRPAELNPPGLP